MHLDVASIDGQFAHRYVQSARPVPEPIMLVQPWWRCGCQLALHQRVHGQCAEVGIRQRNRCETHLLAREHKTVNFQITGAHMHPQAVVAHCIRQRESNVFQAEFPQVDVESFQRIGQCRIGIRR
ncbi:MAG: hypothetical protein IPG74_03150 [Flavobacteriales bacterium]|nr:hypothetical protein [Flavobacteriales bacterium]